MILVRETFIAKPGMASKLAKMFKDMSAEEGWGDNARVMTDLVGKYNTVIMEGQYESLAAWEGIMKKMMEGPQPKPDPSKPKHTDLYTHGRREIFRIW